MKKETSAQSMAESIIRPFQEFFKTEALGGILLMAAAATALILANSPLSHAYHELWETPIGISLADFHLKKSLHHWINDGLMAVFFFLVGLEIKREILVGELSSLKNAILPLTAAIGGMVIPASIYAFFNMNGLGEAGWGIPMATDIAFALGCLALLGKRIPSGLLVFLTALAIVDDIGGIAVIAIFYTEHIVTSSLVQAAVFLFLSYFINKLGVRTPFPYVLIGICLWLMLLKSGIHATVAGILLAITIPANTALRHGDFVKAIREQLYLLTGEKEGAASCLVELDNETKQSIIQKLEHMCHDLETPLQRIMHHLHPWVTFTIIPLFAFANAGVTLDFQSLGQTVSDPVVMGTVLGLVLGKQVGIFGFSWVAVRIGIAGLPSGVTWWHIYGASCLGGIGFTMSLFIGALAFQEPKLLELAKVGILLGSLIAGVGGYLILRQIASYSNS